MYTARLQEPAHESMAGDRYVETDPTSRYGRFEEVLGKGAMKTVYKAIDEVVGMEVAWNQVSLIDLLQDDLQRLYSEIHLLSTLDHSSIIRFHTSWIDIHNRNLNFITEMFTSGTLRQYRAKYTRMNIRAIKTWARRVLEGLVYLHGRDPPVIHRDLKCDNIFVNGHLGEVKIGDLGLAAVLRGSSRAHSVIGTPEFMAPEVYEESYDELVDVYSFGMCVLEMITCEYPYSECSNPAQIYKKVISGMKPRAFYKVEDLDAQRFIGKCLETASKRLPAKELLLDPFLAVVDHVGRQKPFSNHNIKFEHDNVPTTNMTVTGKLNSGDGAIILKVRISDKEGDVRNVFFPFDIANDTPIDVANEMVKELEIKDWQPLEIANMIDGEISGLVPDWKMVENHHSDSAQEEDDDHDHHKLFSPPSPHSHVPASGPVTSHRQDTKPRCFYHRLQGDLFDDGSSTDDQEPATSPKRQGQCKATCRNSCYKMEIPNLMRNRSLVDTQSQLLHRSIIEEVNRRRLFKTVDSVEDIGFRSPYKEARRQEEKTKRLRNIPEPS